ncbi:MAG: aminotransferase class I/II-fold pyridoxal phosphate-dependent enzyme [Armatimonadetes bacterium]|nr:aminotransferase class I/II-fold pyridoxal phosphate-dependent enzyme [Armatimonadota bacterium]
MDKQPNFQIDAYHGVNPSVCDSSTFAFSDPQTMKATFEGDPTGCFLYARHSNPTTTALGQSLAAMEETEAAVITASGMSAITCALLQMCESGDEIVSSRTIYGGTYALFKNIFPRFGITVRFVDMTDHEAVKSAMTERTKAVFFEAVSNPLLDVVDLSAIGAIAHNGNAQMVVDNTFTPYILTPTKFGADVVIHSLTKYINGSSDCIAGAICGTREFCDALISVSSGMCMLLGPTLDPLRAASIHKNFGTLDLRMIQHSRNGMHIARYLSHAGMKVFYPGLEQNRHHKLMVSQMNSHYGFGGMLVLDLGEEATARQYMIRLSDAGVGIIAVSLGYHKTLMSNPGNSTSSEIPEKQRDQMGLTTGFVRMSMGLDQDIQDVAEKMESAWKAVSK